MLKHIPFYASLLNEPLALNTSAKNSHILVYGAIEAHGLGPKGCIASNKTLAEDTGLKESSVKTIISVLTKAGWIKVNLDKNNHRKSIEPLMTINPPVNGHKPPREWSLTIDNSIENTVRRDTGNSKISGENDRISVLFYQVINSLKLPVGNHNVIRKKIKDMKDEDSEESIIEYLIFMRDQFGAADFDFKPDVNNALDIYTKRIQIKNRVKDAAKSQSQQIRFGSKK